MYNFPTNEERLKYYLGKIYYEKFVIEKSYLESKLIENINNVKTDYKVYLNKISTISKHSFNNINNCSYTLDLLNVLKGMNYNYLYCSLGDKYMEDEKLIHKYRINKDKNVILKLNKRRHWNKFQITKTNDIPFKEKLDIIMWRGETNGTYDKRLKCIKDWYNLYNFIDIVMETEDED